MNMEFVMRQPVAMSHMQVCSCGPHTYYPSSPYVSCSPLVPIFSCSLCVISCFIHDQFLFLLPQCVRPTLFLGSVGTFPHLWRVFSLSFLPTFVIPHLAHLKFNNPPFIFDSVGFISSNARFDLAFTFRVHLNDNGRLNAVRIA